MHKWEYLQIHVRSSKSRLVVLVNGEEVPELKESAAEKDLILYLNSLGAQGWELVNADKNK